MSRQWPARIGVAAVAALAASCDRCWERARPVEFASELVAGRLVAIVVSPGNPTVAPGGTQPFTATGLLDDGHSTGVTVTWTATGGVVTAAGLYTAGATPGTFRVIATQQGGILADTSEVSVAAGTGPPAGGLVVAVSGVTASEPKWVLLDTETSAAGATACPQDLALAFTGGSVDVGSLGTCPTQVSAFAADAAPVLDLAPVPTQVAGRSTITENLPPTWTVKLHVVGEYPEAAADAEDGRVLASTLSAANRLGVRFAIDGPVELFDPDGNGSGIPDPRAAAINAGCAGVAASSALRWPGRLNVVYVLNTQWVHGSFNSTFYGFNCYKDGYPDIIFIRQGHAPATLMHEIGHAFFLNHAGLSPSFLLGWPSDNLMQTSIWSMATKAPVDALSLGQVYRASFHDVSWLNASLTRTGATTHCTDESNGPALGSTTPPATWPCPRLQLPWP